VGQYKIHMPTSNVNSRIRFNKNPLNGTPPDVGSMVFQNTGILPHHYTVSQLRGPLK